MSPCLIALELTSQNSSILLSMFIETSVIPYIYNGIKVFNETEYIDKKKLKNIFDKFYRLEDTNDISGSGIGLAICKSIVKLHNGEISAIPKDNGISIEINLPIMKRAKIL